MALQGTLVRTYKNKQHQLILLQTLRATDLLLLYFQLFLQVALVTGSWFSVFLSTAFSASSVRDSWGEKWELGLEAIHPWHSHARHKNSNSANLAFVLAWHVWCELQQVGTYKLTTAANYHIFLSFDIFEKLVIFMGGSFKWHVELISLQYTHPPPLLQNKYVCQTTVSRPKLLHVCC